MDKDFGELIYKQFSFHHGILLLRLEDAVAGKTIRHSKYFFKQLF